VKVCVAVGGTAVGLGVFVGAAVLVATAVFVGALVFVGAAVGTIVVATIAICVAGKVLSVEAIVAAAVLL
jgi:hypothetical protein